MLRVVVDVNVLVPALLRPDTPPAHVVRSWRGGEFELVTSPHLISELTRVTARLPLAGRLDGAAPDALVAALDTHAIAVDDPGTLERIVRRDPEDDYLVALARAAAAHLIVTGDRHLLDLADLDPPALDPGRFVGLLERLE